MDEGSSSFLVFLEAQFNVPIFIFMIVLVILSAFFSMSETAFTNVSDTKLKVAIEGKVSGAKKALLLYEKFDRTLTILLIGNNLVNVALSTFAVAFFTALAVDQKWISLISTLSVTLVLLVFGEIVPKMVAKKHSEAITCKVSWIIYILTYIFLPLVIVFEGLQKLLNRKNEEVNVEKEELEVIIDELENSGEIENNEADVLHNVLDLRNRSVEDIMVPRIKMSAISYDSTLEEVKEYIE